MVKKTAYIIIFILALIFYSCSNSSQADNTDIQQHTNTLNTNDISQQENAFFDMKYIYKAVRVDKTNFNNALLSYYQDVKYTNIINRNKDFLTKKLVGDNDIKKYAIDFISNTYHNSYLNEMNSADLNTDDYTYYYASEYNYVEQNLALKKARDLLLSIKNKDPEIYMALFLSHLATDSLYYFDDMQKYLREWKKLDGTNLNMMIGIVSEANNINKVYSNKMQFINYIIEAPTDLGVEKLVADAYQNGFLNDISKTSGYLDIYNENNYNLSSIVYEGTANIAYFYVVEDIVNTNIINKYLQTYVKTALPKSKMVYDEYYKNFYNLDNSSPKEKYDEMADLYFLEFKKNTFVYSLYDDKLEDVYYFNPAFVGNTRYASFETIEKFNFRLGDDSKLTASNINIIKNSDLIELVKDSKFIVNGKLNKEEYAEYLNEILYFPLYNPLFFLYDINNDGKDEIMLSGTYEHSGGRGGIASYTLLLKDNLELDLESISGKAVNNLDRQGLNSKQKIYEEDGKNKILLIDTIANIAQDVFCDKDVVKVNEFTYKSFSFDSKLLWKGEIVNGVPEGALKTDASFNMFKARSDSDVVIVSDKTLRIADRLISDNYYKEREKLDDKEREKLLENRRAEIKLIQDKHGDVLGIEKEMVNMLGIK